MSQFVKVASALSVGILVALACSPVHAQEVRRYGDQGGGSSGGGGGGGGNQQGRMTYPGAPMPESNQGTNQTTRRRQQQGQAGEGEGEEGEGATASYAIRIHEPGDMPMGRQKPKKQMDEPLNKPPEKMYQGVIPGKRDSVSHLERERQSGSSETNPNALTWIGFQPKEDKTRVFLQTARNPQYSTSREEEGTVFALRLENTKASTRNFRRHVDATNFDRVVKQIRATHEDGGSTVVRIELRESVSPTVETSDNYLYIDFPHESSDGDSSDEGDEA